MLSERKLEANRRNARKSTGPRTPEGKARSSQNALVHGLFSRHMTVAPHENQEDFDALRDALIEEWQPQTVTEHLLVAEMASAQWRRLRIQRMDNGLLARASWQFERATEGAAAPTPDRFFAEAVSADTLNERKMAYLSGLEVVSSRAFHRALRQLEKLHNRPPAPAAKTRLTRPAARPRPLPPPLMLVTLPESADRPAPEPPLRA